METKGIIYRAISPADYDAVEKIIADTWNYARFCTPKTAAALARLFLASCLANQTYTCAALSGEEPVGIIMGKNEKTHRRSLHARLRQLAALLQMLARREGRRVLKQFGGYAAINRALYEESSEHFEGELAFFAVRRDQRGTGVGKTLFGRLQAYMQSQGISDYYLYTDSSCNHGFYDHQGMRVVCEKKCRLKAFEEKEMSFFLYATQRVERLGAGEKQREGVAQTDGATNQAG